MDFLFESKNEFGNVSVYHLHLSKYTGKIWLGFFLPKRELNKSCIDESKVHVLIKI